MPDVHSASIGFFPPLLQTKLFSMFNDYRRIRASIRYLHTLSAYTIYILYLQALTDTSRTCNYIYSYSRLWILFSRQRDNGETCSSIAECLADGALPDSGSSPTYISYTEQLKLQAIEHSSMIQGKYTDYVTANTALL